MNYKLIKALLLALLGMLLLLYTPEQLIQFLGAWSLSALSCLVAYGLGSVPFGLILTKLFLRQDIRETGSGNIGTTNVLRTGHKGLASVTLFLDAGKGAFAVWYLPAFLPVISFPYSGFIIGGLALLGHILPIWLGGKGGKGVATTFGILLILAWPVALLALVTWIVIALTTRYSSLAALIAAILTPLYAYAFADQVYVIFTIFIGAILFYCHRGNIKNLIQGTETKIGRGT
ncbi:MAG: glycerol-3-phosphate 1-O-acyltransferase PlsY [Pseudomonadota bacterium]